MTTVIIREDNLQAKQFIKFVRTLPFAEVKRERKKPQSAWDKAIAEGAVTVDEFIDELQRQLREHYDNA